ncbi:MAG: ATP-dependent Clp protease adapter ClpS [Gammaproteobacteria bacterium]|nr:ATP-dependent Clp protease adapter ClpS [Gammaproteobacteria bacterium]|tara:strand:+ start:8500 stop:8856 length:357 start_codon:yes stop_codon:yes gene_type:complete
MKKNIYDAFLADKLTDSEHHNGVDLVAEETKTTLRYPPLYNVVLINDDFTPMEFVVDILRSVFGMEHNRATQVMLEVHTKGTGLCGIFSHEIAETKVAQVMTIAKQQQHPLMCTMEEK